MEQKPKNLSRENNPQVFNIAPDYTTVNGMGIEDMKWMEVSREQIIEKAKEVRINKPQSESDLERLIKTFIRTPEVPGAIIPGFVLPNGETTNKWTEARAAWMNEARNTR